MNKQSTSELLATAKHHLLLIAQEMEKNGIDIYAARFTRDDEGHVKRCLLTWGMDVEIV
ncbi:MAG: hypothetical protein ACI4B3_08015 [Prevotella sp.]